MNLDLIKTLINEVRNELNSEYNLDDDFMDMCDIACERLSRKLQENSISGVIMNGEVFPDWFYEKNTYSYGHYWIIINGDLIVDPTSDQFRFNFKVFSRDSEHYLKYKEKNEVLSF